MAAPTWMASLPSAHSSLARVRTPIRSPHHAHGQRPPSTPFTAGARLPAADDAAPPSRPRSPPRRAVFPVPSSPPLPPPRRISAVLAWPPPPPLPPPATATPQPPPRPRRTSAHHRRQSSPVGATDPAASHHGPGGVVPSPYTRGDSDGGRRGDGRGEKVQAAATLHPSVASASVRYQDTNTTAGARVSCRKRNPFPPSRARRTAPFAARARPRHPGPSS